MYLHFILQFTEHNEITYGYYKNKIEHLKYLLKVHVPIHGTFYPKSNYHHDFYHVQHRSIPNRGSSMTLFLTAALCFSHCFCFFYIIYEKI